MFFLHCETLKNYLVKTILTYDGYIVCIKMTKIENFSFPITFISKLYFFTFFIPSWHNNLKQIPYFYSSSYLLLC